MAGAPSLELIAIGPPAARVGGAPAPAEVMWRKHFALLIYLALSPHHSRSRAHLLALLWPDRDDSRARHSLNEALHRLRTCLGGDRLTTTGETVTLSPEGLTVDAWDAKADQQGEFLEGFSVGDSQPFDEWIEAERRHRRDAGISALVKEARRMLAEGKPAGAAALARTARTRDPSSEPAVQVLMEALALDRDTSAALAEFRELRERLRELGVQPGPALSALAERIRAGTVESAEASARNPALVGRAAVLATLTDRLPVPPRSGPQLLVILGETGLGKSRILEELSKRAALAGMRVAAVRALPSDQGRAASTLRGLFRGGLLDAPGVLGVAPVNLHRLATVLPELADRFPPQTPADDGELGYALAQVLEAVAEETPLLLMLDDGHLADGTSLSVLQAAFTRLGGCHLGLALAAAPGDPDSSPELVRLQAEVGRGIPGVGVTLEPLGPVELNELIQELAPWATDEDARDRLLRRMLHETSGSPFLTVTLLRGLADTAELQASAAQWPVSQETLSAPLPQGVPPLIQSAVLAQVMRLEPASRDVLAMAASLGNRIDLGLLAAVSGVGEAELVERLTLPERLQLIVATDDGYAFQGAVIANVLAHVGHTPGRRREVRRRGAEYLAGRSDLASRLWRLELLARPAERESLMTEAIELGEALLARGDRHGARRALRLVGEPGANTPEASRTAWLALRTRLDSWTTEEPTAQRRTAR